VGDRTREKTGKDEERKPNYMQTTQRIHALLQLGELLRKEDEYRHAIMHRSSIHNPWFTLENQERAIEAIAEQFLAEAPLNEWLSRYEIPVENEAQTIGLVMAGNLPLVGFHDLLCVFAAGHKAKIKLSDKDPYLLPYLLKLLEKIDPATAAYFEIVERLKDIDAVIATGSNNSARYFEAYFDKYPHIIRKNRNGVAVLTGTENADDLHELGYDVFRYFGLGCRNVAKLYLPQGYNFHPLLEALHEYRDIILHQKYKNNFDYNFALYILNRVHYEANGCILMTENPSLHSRIAGLHYEYYSDLSWLEAELERRSEEIQCVIAQPGLLKTKTFAFGQSQHPALWDYPDGVDTLAFLLQLKQTA
jgi:hypothetical protein